MKIINSLINHTTIVCASLLTQPTFAEHTNFIIIFMDDMGFGDIEENGAKGYETPNITRLANEGIRFTDFYSAQAVSSASRAGLLTGCYPNRIGMHGALSPASTRGINESEETIAEVLKKKNYVTSAVGKLHLGDALQFLPLQNGFDEYLGLPYSNDMWPVYFDGSKNFPKELKRKLSFPNLRLIRNNKTIWEMKTIEDQSELTTLYTETAVNFINRNKKKPFFLYLAHSMPHVPLAVSAKFKGKSKQGLYGDVMMEIDWSVGEIMKALKINRLEKNTLVIFTSDNGPWLNYGNHAGTTGGLREGKGTSFEGGQRVPCIMRWPKRIPAGTICNKLSSTIDILPTLAFISGAELCGNKIDGVNIYSLLTGEKNVYPRTSFLYYYRENSLEAVRNNSFKLVFQHRGRSYEDSLPDNDGRPGKANYKLFEQGLYDLRRDPGERYDVQELYPEVMAELMQLAEEARNDLGDELSGNPGKNRRSAGKIDKSLIKD